MYAYPPPPEIASIPGVIRLPLHRQETKCAPHSYDASAICRTLERQYVLCAPEILRFASPGRKN